MISHFENEPAAGQAEAQDAPPRPLFPLGLIACTPAALDLVGGDHPSHLIPYIRRHATGDFGDLDDDDKQANRDAIAHGGRILSVYLVPVKASAPVKLYVITEADRSSTTVLLADEY